jgi:3-deoxy-D-manno-octulosonic-acid transferase
MRVLYNLGIHLYGFAIFMASFFNDKASIWRSGRKDIFNKISLSIGSSGEPLAWFHCASLGEFEQGRPVIESFRKKFPGYKIMLTFFSPSGYEARKDYKEVDYIFYLPLDTPFNANKFIKIVKPSVAIFVKYEFWFNYLNELKNKNIPCFLISAKFREDQYFFKSPGSWFLKQLHFYKTIFVQDNDSEKLLNKFGITNVIVCGDTRFDRVIAISQETYSNSKLEKFKGNHLLWICGSTWEEDEKIILPVFEKMVQSGIKIKLLIVPHDVNESRVNTIQSNFPALVRYSTSDENQISYANVMVLDRMGLLSYIYRYADMAYVGGGFGKGIHNLPEAAVYGISVIFGPNHNKFTEAFQLIKLKGGFSISSVEELNNCITKLLTDSGFRKNCGKSGASYIYSGKGATEKIISTLENILKSY